MEEYENLDNAVACDDCHKLVHQWVMSDGYILCKACYVGQFSLGSRERDSLSSDGGADAHA